MLFSAVYWKYPIISITPIYAQIRKEETYPRYTYSLYKPG